MFGVVVDATVSVKRSVDTREAQEPVIEIARYILTMKENTNTSTNPKEQKRCVLQ